MKIIELFNSIRDIPYKIPLSLKDKCVDCDKKHQKLSLLLSDAGLKVRFRVCIFLWSDLAIPKHILAIPHREQCEHLYLEALVEGHWIVLDATWDIGLQKILPVNIWDGKSNTELAVKPVQIYEVGEHIRLSHTETNENFVKDIEESGKFYDEFNKWLETERIKSK